MIDRLLAMNIAQQAQIDLLFALVEEVGKKGGVTHVEGVPLRDWFQKKKLEELDRMLIATEDKDPATAAALQQIIDESRSRLGE